MTNGPFSFELQISSDDPGHSIYQITVIGTGIGDSPNIDIQRPRGSSIPNGGTDEIGDHAIGAESSVTYVVENRGIATLNITNIISALASNVTGIDIDPSSFSVEVGSFEFFTVAFTPSVDGLFRFDLEIDNDDPDEDPYAITIEGRGTSASLGSEPVPGDVILGDADGNGRVDIMDVRTCLQLLFGLITGSNSQVQCDIDADGAVTLQDVRILAQWLIGLRSSLAAAGILNGAILFVGFSLVLLGDRKRRLSLCSGLLACMLLLMTGCWLFPPGTSALFAIVSDQFVTISVQNMPGGGIASFSATDGGFIFDPSTTSVESIQAIGGFELIASQIDNSTGEVKWAIANPTGGVVSGVLLILNISAKSQDFTPDQTGIHWRRGKLMIGDDANMEIKPKEYRVFPAN